MFEKLFPRQVNIEDLLVDVSGCSYEGLTQGVKVWRTAFGDAFGVYYFPMRPDLPSDLSQVEQDYQGQLAAINGKLVEYQIDQIDGFDVIKMLLKVPQPQSGMAYVYSVTIPFENCSYVVKGQFEEYGTTGLREAVLTEKLFGQDFSGTFDDEKYDADFPDHPVSRARKVFRENIKKISFSDRLKKCEPFF